MSGSPRICKGVTKTVVAIIGNQQIGPSDPYSTIATFKAQNRIITPRCYDGAPYERRRLAKLRIGDGQLVAFTSVKGN
jgi:hypothetical protein